MRRPALLIAGLVLLSAAAALPRGASAATSIADILPESTSTPTPAATATPTPTPVSTATPTPTPTELAPTGADSTVPLALLSLGAVAFSASQLRRRSR